jgi:acyl-CoA oxidase
MTELILAFFQMLMKHTQVSREGIVTDPPLAQLTYGALLSGRIAMVADSSNTAKKVRTCPSLLLVTGAQLTSQLDHLSRRL